MTVQLSKNAEMHEEVNKPIFVVGSPRSGTSILAWCLGYHPNIFPVPESNWMGDFAVDVARSYQVGASRGIFSILSAMDISRDEFVSHIGRSINSLIIKHRGDLDRKRLITAVQRLLKEQGLYLGEVTGELDAATSAALRQYGIADEANVVTLFDPVRIGQFQDLGLVHRGLGREVVAVEVLQRRERCLLDPGFEHVGRPRRYLQFCQTQEVLLVILVGCRRFASQGFELGVHRRQPEVFQVGLQ